MISLWKTATELERLTDLQKVAIDCYALALATTAQYAVEADRTQVVEFRKHLEALEERLRAASTTENLQEVAASYRGELRDYRDKAQSRLDRLRREVQGAAEVMKSFAESVASNGADHEDQLERELQSLQVLTRSDDIREVHGGIHEATRSIAASLDQMRRSNQLVIAQLQDEIRLLHQELQAERRALLTDHSSGAWNRQKLEGRIDELLRQDDTFCLLLVGLRNFKQLEGPYSQTVISGALKAFLLRIQEILGIEAVVGRWAEDAFIAILPMEPSDVMALSREVTRKLSGAYAVQENGLSHNVTLQVTAGIVDRRAGNDATKFHKQLERMAETLMSG